MESIGLAKQVYDSFSRWLSEPIVFRGQPALTLTEPSKLVELCLYLKERVGMKLVLDITAVDFPKQDPRFLLTYHFLRLEDSAMLRLHLWVRAEPAIVPSVTSVWPSANWHEREVWDMFGIRFEGHPDLRRILMWEGYPYHPLRKDFPLAGNATEARNVAFTEKARPEGGPFAGGQGVHAFEREPRSREPDQDC